MTEICSCRQDLNSVSDFLNPRDKLGTESETATRYQGQKVPYLKALADYVTEALQLETDYRDLNCELDFDQDVVEFEFKQEELEQICQQDFERYESMDSSAPVRYFIREFNGWRQPTSGVLTYKKNEETEGGSSSQLKVQIKHPI